MPRQTTAELLAARDLKISQLEASIDRLIQENAQLKDALSDKSYPAETLIETLEQTILKATKICSDALRGLKGGA